MTSAITKISTITASGNSTILDFTSIPQTYEDLIVKVQLRSGRASGPIQDGVLLRFNSVGTSTYAYQTMYSDSGAAQGDLSASASSIFAGYVPTTNNTANVYSNGEIYITDYADTTHYKAVKSDIVDATDSSAGYLFLGAGTFLSNSAITSIALLTGSGQNWVAGSTATLYGVTKATGETGSKATGGTMTTSGGYTYHTFFTSGNFIPTTNITGAEVLVVAGGGAGGGNKAGGGGAGGVVYASSQSFTSGVNYAAIVGAGGAGSVNTRGNSGTNSVFAAGTVAIGGGGGGGYDGTGSVANGATGGSGGAGAGSDASGGQGTGASGTAGQGNAGGNGVYISTNTAAGGGGGGAGGAGSAGSGSPGDALGGTGGVGTSTYSAWGIATSTGQNSGGTVYYAGGGAGGTRSGRLNVWPGGLGGGGQGSDDVTNLPGLAFSGGGGGASGQTGSKAGGNGGSGVVIVRYTT